MVSLFRNDPLYNSIRHEDQFQKIQKRVESKHQAEHERVRKWLEDAIYLPCIQLFHNFIKINYPHGRPYPRIRI